MQRNLVTTSSAARLVVPNTNHRLVPVGVERCSFASRNLHTDLILQFVICVTPLLPAFLLGHGSLLGQAAFFLGLGLLLMYHAIQRHPFHFLTLIVSSIPLLMLLRGIYIPYNSVLVLLALGFSCALLGPRNFPGLWKRSSLQYVIMGSVVYWWISMLLSGDYNRNLRTIDWALCVAIVLMLSERRSYLRTAMLGWGISAAVGGLMLLPYGDRVGLAMINGMQMGNPILIGVPCAFVLLLSIAERGR
jgi:hypothetical protein